MSNDEDEVARRSRCGITTWTDMDGLVHHEVVLPPEEGKLLERAIEYGMEQVYQERRAVQKAARAEGREPELAPVRTAKQRRYEG